MRFGHLQNLWARLFDQRILSPVGSRRRTINSRRRRLTMSVVERLEDRSLLTPPAFLLSAVPATVFENAGASASQVTITRPPSAEIYVTVNNQLATYCVDGTLDNTTPVPYATGNRPAGEVVRDVAYGFTNGFVNVYNGTATPSLSRLDTAAISANWVHSTTSELSTASTASFGGIATFGTFVYLTDMNTVGATSAGIVRYNSVNSAFQRFSTATDYIDVALGVNNSLYALRSNGTSVDVYDPSTMNLNTTITLGVVVRAIAADAGGQIFGGSSTGFFHRFSAGGVQQATLVSGVASLTDLDLDRYGLLIAGSTTGDVVQTTSAFTAPVRFSAGTGPTFVGFHRESLGPMSVTLISSNTNKIAIPFTPVLFGEGQTAATVPVDAVDNNLLDGPFTVAVTAAGDCYTPGSVNIDVLDYESLTIAITATSMAENAGPNAITGRITRGNAGNAQTYTLTSSDPTEATVPATVTIPAGQSSVTFPINAIDDTLLDGSQTVTISANAPQYIVFGDTIQVTDYETLTVAIAANSVVENGGAGASTGTVTRGNTDLGLPVTVNIGSSDTTEVADGGAVTILAGQSSATFNIDAVDDNLLDGTQTVTLTPTAPGYVSIADTIDVTDLENLSITVAASSVSEDAGATATTVTITRLNSNVGSPLTLALASSDTSEATVPLNVIIPSGLNSITVPVTAVDDNLLDGTQSVTISATAISYQLVSVNLNVTDRETITVTVNPVSFLETAGINATTGTVTRSNTDIGTSLTVNLVSNDLTEATVPASVIIPAGQASATFGINAADDVIADGTQIVTITPSATNYVGVASTVNVLDNETLTVDIAAVSVLESAGAGATMVTVTRNDGQTATALVVTLLSSDTTEATVQGTVTIPIGSLSVTFNLDATDDTLLDGPQTVTISASALGYVSGSDTVIVADAPLITDIIDQNINEDTPTTAIPFTLSDIAGDMTITAASSNPTLIPVANVVFGGTGFNRTVTVTPAANQFGSATITVTAANGSSSVSDTFVVNVASVNDLPTISDVTSKTTNEDVPAGPIGFNIGDVETPVASLVVTASSTNQTLVPNASIVLGGTGATRTVTVNPAANLFGATTISLTVTDANGDTATDTFDVTVNTVADTPSVTNATTDEDVQSSTGLVISRNPADGNEVTHFKISGITGGTLFQNDGATFIGNNSFITVAQGTAGLKFTPTLHSSQPGTFAIQASLSASTAGLGGTLITATITVNEVNDTPTISDIASLTISEDQLASINFTVGDVETLPGFLVVTVASNNTTLVPPSSVEIIGTGANRTLKITPAPNTSGVATITVTVNDGSAANSTASDQFQLTVTSVPDRPGVTSTVTREDTQTSSGLVVTRSPADGTDVTHFKIDRVAGGSVFLNDSVTPVAEGGFITITQGSFGLRFSPNPNFHGAATFRVRGSTSAADIGLGTESTVAFVEVQPVADTPSITDGQSAQNLPTTSGLGVSRNPVDGQETTHLYVTNITGGRLYFNNGQTLINNGDFINITQASPSLKFTPDETSRGQGSFVLQAATGSFIGNIGGDPITAHVTVNGPLTRMYRAYNKLADRHLYTTSRGEFNAVVGLGFGDESTNNRGFAVNSTPFQGTSQLFRLYNLGSGTHYYTASINERTFLLQQTPVNFPFSQQVGWRDEGVEGYIFAAPQPGTTPIYHLYNVNSGSHLFTESLSQKNDIVRTFPTVWREDGLLGYAYAFSQQGVVTVATSRRAASGEQAASQFSPISTETARAATLPGDESATRVAVGLLSVTQQSAFSHTADLRSQFVNDLRDTRLSPRATCPPTGAALSDLPGLVDAAWQQFGEQLADW
jgi:hypothetical protein